MKRVFLFPNMQKGMAVCHAFLFFVLYLGKFKDCFLHDEGTAYLGNVL